MLCKKRIITLIDDAAGYNEGKDNCQRSLFDVGRVTRVSLQTPFQADKGCAVRFVDYIARFSTYIVNLSTIIGEISQDNPQISSPQT